MTFKKVFSYICIVIGLFVAFYAQAGEEQNVYVLIVGIVALMYGLYSISTGIASKSESSNYNEKDEEQHEH